MESRSWTELVSFLANYGLGHYNRLGQCHVQKNPQLRKVGEVEVFVPLAFNLINMRLSEDTRKLPLEPISVSNVPKHVLEGPTFMKNVSVALHSSC